MPAEIEALFVRPYEDLFASGLGHTHANGIKKFLTADIVAELPQSYRQNHGKSMNPFGNPTQALWPVIDRIHARHDGQEHLSCADVARGLFPPDVLLAGLQRESVGDTSRPIFGDADDAPRYLPLIVFFRGKKCGMGAAESHRHAEPLAGPHRNIGAEVTRRTQ